MTWAPPCPAQNYTKSIAPSLSISHESEYVDCGWNALPGYRKAVLARSSGGDLRAGQETKKPSGKAIPGRILVCQFGILPAKAGQPLVRISTVLTIRLKSVTR